MGWLTMVGGLFLPVILDSYGYDLPRFMRDEGALWYIIVGAGYIIGLTYLSWFISRLIDDKF